MEPFSIFYSELFISYFRYLCTNALLGHLIHQFGEGDRIEVLESSKVFNVLDVEHVVALVKFSHVL